MLIESDTFNWMVEISYTSALLVGQQTCSEAPLWLLSALGGPGHIWLSLKTLIESFGYGLGMRTLVRRSIFVAVVGAYQKAMNLEQRVALADEGLHLH